MATRQADPFSRHDPVARFALVAAPLDPQTYRNLGFLLLSIPLGLAYLAFLAAGFGLVPGALSGASARLAIVGEPAALGAAVVCLAAGVLALPALLPVLDVAQRVLGFERRLIGALLGGRVSIATTPLAAAGAAGRGPWRRLPTRLADLGLARGLTYLAIKLPLAVLGLAVVGGSAALVGALLLAPALADTASLGATYAAVGIDQTRETWLCVFVAFPVFGLAVQAVNGLAWLARELARLLLASPDVARYEWATR